MLSGAKILVPFILLFTLISAAAPGSVNQRSSKGAMDQNRFIANALQEIQSVQPNMKRRDLAKVFTTEGGLSTRLSRVYVYKKCPYIKVKFDFQAAAGTEKLSGDSPDDKIVRISQPYLEYPRSD